MIGTDDSDPDQRLGLSRIDGATLDSEVPPTVQPQGVLGMCHAGRCHAWQRLHALDDLAMRRGYLLDLRILPGWEVHPHRDHVLRLDPQIDAEDVAEALRE